MAYTTTQLQALQNALASGVTRVAFEGRSVDYGTVENLKLAIQTVQNDLNKQNGLSRIRQVRVIANKGFNWPEVF